MNQIELFKQMLRDAGIEFEEVENKPFAHNIVCPYQNDARIIYYFNATTGQLVDFDLEIFPR